MLKIKKGFTLIELLVVIAIIGLLAAAVSVAIVGRQKNARDARRMTDIKTVATALDLYYNDNGGVYPTFLVGTNQFTSLVLTNYIPTLPKDPTNDATYFYSYISNSDSQNYTMKATLETAPTTFECKNGSCIRK